MKLSSSIRIFVVVSALCLGSHTGSAQTAAQFIAKGDASDRTFDAGEALKSYLAAEKQEPKNVQLLVSIARQYRHLMTKAPTDKEKLRLGGSALSYGLKAAALGPHDSDAQLSTAITYGKMLPFQGRQAQVDAAPRIKAAVDRALHLNPRNDSAWHVLGRCTSRWPTSAVSNAPSAGFSMARCPSAPTRKLSRALTRPSPSIPAASAIMSNWGGPMPKWANMTMPASIS